MNKSHLLCKRAFLAMLTILLILGLTACNSNHSNIDLSEYLGKTLSEIESALDVEFIDMSQYRGFDNTFRAKKRDGEFDCVIDATGKVTRIHVLLSGKNGYSLFGVTSDMDAETANKILNQNSIYHVYDTVWCCANEADAVIQEGLGWSLEKNSAILEEALFLAFIEENFTYQYDDSDGAYYIGNGQVVEYYYDSFPRFVYDYENLSAYQQSSAGEVLDGRYIAVSGNITAIDPDGKVTVFCEDQEASEAAGLLLPMMGFAELYLTPEQLPLLGKLSVDDTILAFGRIDMSSYYSVICGIFQLESSVVVSVSGEDIEVPFIQTSYPGLTTFNEDGSTQENGAGIWEDPSSQEYIDPMQQEYDRACNLLTNGDYNSALSIFESLDDYKDSKRHVDGIRCINYAKQVSNAITSQYYSLRLVGINVSCEYSPENYTFSVTWEVPNSGLFGQLSSLGVAAGEEVTWSQEGCESQAEKVYYDYFMPEGYTGIVCEYNIRDMANDTYLTGTYSFTHPSLETTTQGTDLFETQEPTQTAPDTYSLGIIREARDYHDGVAWIQFEFPEVTTWCCCDMDGNILFSLDPESVPTTYFSNGVAIVNKDRIVNKTGDIVWSLEQDGINAANHFWGEGSLESVRIFGHDNRDDFYGYTLVRFEVDCYDYTGDMTGVVDSDGTWRLEPVNDLTVENDHAGGINGVYHLSFEVDQSEDRYYDIVSNEFIDGNEYYNRNNGYKFDEHNGLIYKEKRDPANYYNQLSGFYDANDNLVIDLTEYHMDTEDGIPEFNDGYAILKIKNDQGSPYYTIIDTTGKEMFPPRKRVWHDELRCGYYWVYGEGYMNVYGECAFDKEFIYGTAFSEGRAFVTVKENNEYVKHCINLNGDIVY